MSDLPPLARVVVEAAVCRFIGRPRDENPYDSVHGEAQHNCWDWAWGAADYLLERTGEEEIRRWLREAQ